MTNDRILKAVWYYKPQGKRDTNRPKYDGLTKQIECCNRMKNSLI
jgi:hypothetical protein